ncbi:MAG TPA: MnhB domain-containing protein [Actinomycetota bacterium]|nr:MnhB domain-containing protein [Actinomycetota bacterium]
MSIAGRRAAFLAGAAVLVALLTWGFAGLLPGRPAGPTPRVGDLLASASGPDRHVVDPVALVGLDARSLDALVAAFTVVAAVAGTTLVLRARPDEWAGHALDFATGRRVPPTSDAVRVLGLGLTPPTVLFGLYLVTHGQLSPGGGFQGGVVLAAGVLLIYLAGEFEDLHGLYGDRALERGLAAGAGGTVAIGFLGLAAGPAFLANALPLGRTGDVLSGGTIPLLDVVLGLGIAVGFVALLTTFLHQAIVLRPLGARR